MNEITVTREAQSMFGLRILFRGMEFCQSTAHEWRQSQTKRVDEECTAMKADNGEKTRIIDVRPTKKYLAYKL